MVLLLAVGLVEMAALVAVAVAVVVAVVKTRAQDAGAAAKYARSAGLPLPPDLTPWIVGRLRRRMRARIAGSGAAAAVGLLVVAFMGMGALAARSGAAERAWLTATHLVNPASLVLMQIAGIVTGGLYDIRRARPRVGVRTSARLRDAVPPGVTWWARAIALGPGALWLAALVLPRGSLPPGVPALPVWVWLAATVGALAVAGAVERLQLAVLRMPCRAGAGPGELAFEAAFRAETALTLTGLAAAGPVAGLAFLSFHAARAAGTVLGGWERWQVLLLAWAAVAPALVVLTLIPAGLPWSRRRFLGRYLAGAA